MSLAWQVRMAAGTETFPHGWRVRRIGDLVTLTNGFPFPSESFGPIGDMPLVRIRDLGDDPFETFVSGHVPPSVVLRNGDVVIGMDGDFNLAIWNKGEAALNQRLCLLRPRPGIDMRFVAYALPSSLKIINDLTFSTTVKHLSSTDVLSERIMLPPLEEQRRIADFLDGETARMSTLRDSLRRFDQDVRERERAVLAQQLNAGIRSVCAQLPSGWQWTPLMHLTDPLRQIMYGIVLPGPNVSDGVPIVKGGDVAANRLSPNSLHRTTREIESGYARSRLKGGDLVIAIRGSVGEVAVVPAELTGANLTQDAARISIDRSVHAEWLRLVLESPLVTHQIQQRVTGATIKGINIWDLKRILVPTPDVETQAVLATTAGRAIQTHENLRSRVAQHDRLLAERRQALITAAVAGQFDVSTASGRNVTDGVPA
ncbi:restriction endonuclease subunit S [Streptomyces sp. 049-1]|uniref:restriction endonuclease subunit S n=1 Tax=Streptomyces sp. 049-1 TaxID=2789264 RepID=UPI00397F05FD